MVLRLQSLTPFSCICRVALTGHAEYALDNNQALWLTTVLVLICTSLFCLAVAIMCSWRAQSANTFYWSPSAIHGALSPLLKGASRLIQSGQTADASPRKELITGAVATGKVVKVTSYCTNTARSLVSIPQLNIGSALAANSAAWYLSVASSSAFSALALPCIVELQYFGTAWALIIGILIGIEAGLVVVSIIVRAVTSRSLHASFLMRAIFRELNSYGMRWKSGNSDQPVIFYPRSGTPKHKDINEALQSDASAAQAFELGDGFARVGNQWLDESTSAYVRSSGLALLSVLILALISRLGSGVPAVNAMLSFIVTLKAASFGASFYAVLLRVIASVIHVRAGSILVKLNIGDPITLEHGGVISFAWFLWTSKPNQNGHSVRDWLEIVDTQSAGVSAGPPRDDG